jgi:hypothetical protein
LIFLHSMLTRVEGKKYSHYKVFLENSHNELCIGSLLCKLLTLNTMVYNCNNMYS